MLMQRYLAVLATALLFGYAAPASSSDANKTLSEALERALPSLVSSGDYWSTSKLYFQLASARSRMNEAAAACAALSQSLDYYRKALAKDTGAPLYEVAPAGGDDAGMQEIRSKFHCTRAQFG